MHIRCVQIILFVPAGGRQNDVGIDTGRRHAKIERDQKVEFALRRIIMPDDLLRLLRACFAKILTLNAVLRAEQMF